MSIQRYGRSIVAYIIMGLLLGAGISLIVYGITLFIVTTVNAFSSMYEAGMNAPPPTHEIGVNIASVGPPERVPEYVYVNLGDETVFLPKPSNPALSAVFSSLAPLLAVVGGALASVTIVAVLIALNIITISQDEE